MSYLQDLVINHAKMLGVAKASEYFDVSPQLVRQWIAGSKPISLAAVERVFRIPEQASEEAAWEGKKVMLLLPWYKQTNPVTAFGLLALLNREKMGVAMEFGDAMIAHARNVLLDRLIETGIEWGLMLDDDMILPVGNAGWFNRYTGMNLPEAYAGRHAINQLMSHNRTLVSALYFGRNPTGRGMYYESLVADQSGSDENRRAHLAPREELKQVSWAGTGCILIHRKVVEDIRRQMPWLAPKHPSEPWQYFSNASDGLLSAVDRLTDETSRMLSQVVAGETTYDAIEKHLDGVRSQLVEASQSVTRDNRLQSGEDAIFGIRAAKCGHPTFVDMSVVCGHVGAAVYGPRNTLVN